MFTLRSLSAAFVALSTCCQLMSAMPSITYTYPEKSGISINEASGSAFAAAIGNWLSPETKELLRPILPNSVIVNNQTDKAIVAVCVRWTLTDLEGRVTVDDMTLQTLIKDRRFMADPGGAVFMSPYTALNRKIELGKGTRVMESTFKWPDLNRYAGQRAINISIDSVIFEDGTIIGPDQNKTAEKLSAWLRAEKEIVDQVLSKQGEALKQYLMSVSSTKVDGSMLQGSSEKFYNDRTTSFSKTLLGLLQREGEGRLLSVCKSTQNAERILLPKGK